MFREKQNLSDVYRSFTKTETKVLLQVWNYYKRSTPITEGMLPFASARGMQSLLEEYRLAYEDEDLDDDDVHFITVQEKTIILENLSFKFEVFQMFGIWPKRKRERL